MDPCPSYEEQFPVDNPGGAFAAPAIKVEPTPHPDIAPVASERSKPRTLGPDEITTVSSEKNSLEAKNKSMFEELVEIVRRRRTKRNYALDWTVECRRIVLAKSAAAMQSALIETWGLTAKASIGVKRVANFDFKKLSDGAWSDDWKGDFFTELWELKEDLDLMRYRLEMNKRTIERLTRIQKPRDEKPRDEKPWDEKPPWYEKSRNVRLMEEKLKDKMLEYETLKYEMLKYEKPDTSLIDALQNDLEEWEGLMQMNDYAFKIMQRTTDTYVNAVSATGARFANFQAQNSRKLTGYVF